MLFILRWLKEEYCTKGKMLYMSFVDLEIDFDRVPRKVLGNEEEMNTRSFG